MMIKKTAVTTLVAGLLFGLSAQVHANIMPGSTIVPLIVAGAPPDSPGNRVDPNTGSSDFSGVVSINIRFGPAANQSFICSGALVSKRDVVTAGHCLDSNGQGTLIDIHAPGADVRVIFNASPIVGDPGRAIVTADHVSMNPNYQGFGNCPSGVSGFCLNDDVAVVHMNADAPAAAKIYRMYNGTPILGGQLVTMVGYGLSGDGLNGYTVNPSFRIKRRGQNIMDLFDLDDEQNFAAGPEEVWYADFDGNGEDTFCSFGLACSAQLANDQESMIGGGDSGGPSFVKMGNEFVLLGNNTFGSNFGANGPAPGAFGNYFGGMLLNAYTDYLESATSGAIGLVPEPGSIIMLALGLGLLMLRRRSTM